MGVFISYVVAKGILISNLPGGLIAEGIKAAFQWTFFLIDFFREASGSSKMLAAAIANFIMGFIALATNVGAMFVKALYNVIMGATMATLMMTTSKMIGLAVPFRIFRTAVDYVESFLVDFPIAILALLRYLDVV